MKLKPFQIEFERAVEDPRYDVVCLSGPRSLGKTFMAARILTRCLTPGDSMFADGREVVLGAASLPQARLTYQFIRAALEPLGGYRFVDSATRLAITHLPSNTKLRAISSDANTSFGLVNVDVVCIDEPGALDLRGGELLYQSLMTSRGKVGSKITIVLIGTLGPRATKAGHWWYDLVNRGTRATTHVQYFHGDLATWDSWATIRKANPLVSVDAGFRKTLLQERDDARIDSRAKATFLTYRLNIPSENESRVLLTVDDWKRMVERPVPEREGRAILAVDLAEGRAWSAACAVWEKGRMEAIALAPGDPSIEDQEVRDRQPKGSYQKLVDAGLLHIDEGYQVQRPHILWEQVKDWLGDVPVKVVSDRFELKKWRDAIRLETRVEERVWQWSQASEDIYSLRSGIKDGPLVVDEASRPLVAHSLAEAVVENDQSGSSRLVKRDPSNNTGRDDVAVAVTLAAGAWDRAMQDQDQEVGEVEFALV